MPHGTGTKKVTSSKTGAKVLRTYCQKSVFFGVGTSEDECFLIEREQFRLNRLSLKPEHLVT